LKELLKIYQEITETKKIKDELNLYIKKIEDENLELKPFDNPPNKIVFN
jgi:hypothetical protein